MADQESDRAKFDETLFYLLGKEVRVIKYIESPPLDDLIGWARFKDQFHVVQQGIQLTYPGLHGTEDAFLNWNGNFYQYGLGFGRGAWTDYVVNGAVWDVSAERPWSRFLPAIVTGVAIYWHSTGADGDGDGGGAAAWPKALYPRDIELTFNKQFKIFCTAAHYDEERSGLDFAAHNVIVAWNEGFADEHKVCSYGEAARVSCRELDAIGRLG